MVVVVVDVVLVPDMFCTVPHDKEISPGRLQFYGTKIKKKENPPFCQPTAALCTLGMKQSERETGRKATGLVPDNRKQQGARELDSSPSLGIPSLPVSRFQVPPARNW